MNQRDFLKLRKGQKAIYCHADPKTKEVGIYETVIREVVHCQGRPSLCEFQISKAIVDKGLAPGSLVSCFAGRRLDELGKEYIFYPEEKNYISVD